MKPQPLSGVPIGLAFSNPGMLWQPKQPSRLIVFSPMYISFSSCESFVFDEAVDLAERDRDLLAAQGDAPLGDVELDQLVEPLLDLGASRRPGRSTGTGHSPGIERIQEAMSAASWNESWTLGIRLLGWYASGALIQLASQR